MNRQDNFINRFLQSINNWQETELEEATLLTDVKNWKTLAYDPDKPTKDMLSYTSIEQWLHVRLEPKTNDNLLELIIFRGLMSRLAARALYTISNSQKKCQSPIESAMLAALTIIGINTDTQLSLVLEGYPSRLTHALANDLMIEPQAKIGKYRVDFLVTYVERWEDGIELARTQMAIECDGHYFHDRTKEQARKDKERDRMLQSLGLRVYRYTGSEIWADVFKCACQAINELIRETRRKPPVAEKYKGSLLYYGENKY